jgi:hypothetical protein
MKHLRNLFGAAMLLVTALTLTGCGNGDNALEEIINNGGSSTPSFNALETPLTFEAVSGTVTMTINNTNATDKTLEYKVDDAEWAFKTVAAGTTFDLPAGKVIQFRGEEATYGVLAGFTHLCIFGDADYYVYGNIMSLVDKDNFATNKTLTGDATFLALFTKDTGYIVVNDKLKKHPSKTLTLPATTLTKACYYGLFQYCTGLTEVPFESLPAKTMVESCYSAMFNATALTSIPEKLLPATTLAKSCYEDMFHGCAYLTTIPSKLLPATTLAESCYNSMFCLTGITSLPSDMLPATQMKKDCYYRMFQMSKLQSIPAGLLPSMNLAESCYEHMFSHCPDLTNVPYSLLPATTLAVECYYHMFYNCPELVSSPKLGASTLVDYCYGNMFTDCVKLGSITCLATSGFHTGSGDPLVNWLENTGNSAGSKTIVIDSSLGLADPTPWVQNSNSGIPTGWTISH